MWKAEHRKGCENEGDLRDSEKQKLVLDAQENGKSMILDDKRCNMIGRLRAGDDPCCRDL